jgi:23S rRNA (cytidine1920-2'-O)/16S rRNA (cytidine1409-2'-O)-methyltransferase
MVKPEKKARVDELAVEQGLAEDVIAARKLILAGEIRSGDHVWDKAGEKINRSTMLELKSRRCRWVSRGGLKLEKAVKSFNIDVNNRRCLDIGASTGGFTDVLLFYGAAEVVAVDVGYGLLDARLQNHPKVTVKDRTNFRNLSPDALGERFDIAVTDVSFISLELILPNASAMIKDDGCIVALIKPQFEAERFQVPEGGIITDPEIHFQVITSLQNFSAEKCGLLLHKLDFVPSVNAKKNIEFLSLWKKNCNNNEACSLQQIKDLIDRAHTARNS